MIKAVSHLREVPGARALQVLSSTGAFRRTEPRSLSACGRLPEQFLAEFFSAPCRRARPTGRPSVAAGLPVLMQVGQSVCRCNRFMVM